MPSPRTHPDHPQFFVHNDHFRPRPIPHLVIPPRTEEEMDQVVEEACRFIEAVVQRHGKALGSEIGEYMYLNVLGADDEYMRSRHRAKTRSYRDIAAATGLKARTLWGWTRSAVARIKLREHGLDTTLGLRHLEHVGRLIDNIEAAAAIARWAEDEEVTATQLQEAVRLWIRHLADHKPLQQIIDDPPCPPRPRRKRRKKNPHGRPDADDLLLPRVLLMLGEWLETVDLTRSQAERLKKRLVALRRSIRAGRRS